jgi:hypothetical protein
MPDAPRPKSLRLSSRPVNVPVPPSLAKSPHLHSPQSIFRRAISVPRLPSEEDEVWLRDTVPLSKETGGEIKDSSESGKSTEEELKQTRESQEATRGRSGELRVLSHSTTPPPSPPLVRWPSVPSSRENWLDRTMMARSDTHVPQLGQGYFTPR